MTSIPWQMCVAPGTIVTLLISASINAARADLPPQRPKADEEVIAVLRPSRVSAADRELRHWRQSLGEDPGNLPLACTVARRCIQRSRDEADPRFLGAAVGALTPWWAKVDPGPEVLLLRATIRQSFHDFDAAIVDLNAAVMIDPRLTQAWLTMATVHCVRGDFPAARMAAVHLAGLADPLTATTVAAQIASLTGRARQARVALEGALAAEMDRRAAGRAGDNGIEVWARTVLAETSARLGDSGAAERQFKQAIEAGPRDPYLLAAHADFLLDHDRRDEVVRSLRGMERMDGLLLRLAEATLDPELHRAVAERLDSALARGDRVHLREASRFELRLRDNPSIALRHAIDNWEVQREPADARVLWDAALATGNLPAMEKVKSWVNQSGLEDVTLPAAGTGLQRSDSSDTRAP